MKNYNFMRFYFAGKERCHLQSEVKEKLCNGTQGGTQGGTEGVCDNMV